MKKMKIKLLISFLWSICFLNLSAQKTIVKAELNNLEKSGFYKIPLSIEFRSYLKNDFSNLRILDSAGKEQAFYIETESPKQYKSDSLALKIISQNVIRKQSQLIVENQEKLILTSIVLEIKNAYVSKELTIEGSADLTNWYALINKTNIYCSDGKQLSCMLPISLPRNDFPYLRISLNDSLTAPIFIKNVFCVKQDIQKGAYNIFPSIQFSQKDSSDKNTYVNVNLKKIQQIDRMAFFISGLPFYNRKISYSYTNDSIFSQFSYLGILNSNSQNSFDFNNEAVTKIRFKIENEDNQAIKIDSIHFLQTLKNAVVYLNKAEKYFLLAGHDSLQFPSYDIQAFKQKMPEYLPIVEAKITNIETLLEPKKAEDELNIFTNKWFIWTALILVGALLIYISFKMLSEMKNKS